MQGMDNNIVVDTLFLTPFCVAVNIRVSVWKASSKYMWWMCVRCVGFYIYGYIPNGGITNDIMNPYPFSSLIHAHKITGIEKLPWSLILLCVYAGGGEKQRETNKIISFRLNFWYISIVCFLFSVHRVDYDICSTI